jgi:UDP-N-acetylmuramoylalanine--D-glutamate ligase
MDAELQELADAGVAFSAGEDVPGIGRADLVIPSPAVPARAPVLQAAVQCGIPVWSEVEVAYRMSVAPLVAWTATNGKSTTTALTGHMLSCAGIRARIGGNLAPGIPLIQLAEKSIPTEVLVAEISSYQLEWIDRLRPRAGGILNISPDHLERYGTMQAYAATKARLVERQCRLDIAIFGDSFAEQYPDLLQGDGRHYRFCREHPVEAGAYMAGSVMRIVGRTDPSEGSLPDLKIDTSRFVLAGAFNLNNAMAASLAALEMGAHPEAIERALRTFEGLPHRMEWVGDVGGVHFINNSMCTNSAAAIASLDAVDGGLIAITGGSSKKLDMSEFGTALARRAQWIVLIGSTAEEMEAHLKNAGCNAWEYAGSMSEAVELAAARARPGESVLLIPGYASFDMFGDFEDRGRAFVEAVRAHGALCAEGAGNGT